MIITVLHRPKPGDLYPLFRLQQDMVHQLGLKATILAIWPIMNEERIVDDMLGFRRKHGDEIGLFFGDLACPEFTETTGHVQNAFWLYSAEDKRRIAGTLLERFERCFGGPPRSVAGFCLDASSLRIIKEMCPAVETACACCFEEGVPTFHGTNNSWYLFNEGGPWGPWYPSKSHTLRPALSEEDSAGVVAVPHLARDMALSYESRNDFFSSHPPNVLRGKGNDGDECPYSLNLIDEYRRQERYNNGFSYMNLFVSPNWLGHSVNFEETPEVAQKLYRITSILGGAARRGPSNRYALGRIRPLVSKQPAHHSFRRVLGPRNSLRFG
ncbi:MAG: hypothetical protein GWP08_14845 [Nitrospiraceae bacterium]|nr:hypothetical protein [Nitrospiraceae bacterium]